MTRANLSEKKETTKSKSIIGSKNIHEALEMAGGDWDVYPDKLMTQGLIDVPTHKVILRQDTNIPLGVVGKDYEIINNLNSFSFFDAIVQQNKATYHNYQEFDGGQKVVITAKFGKNYDANPKLGDIIESEIKLINSFDGSSSFSVIFSALRLVCTNGMVSNSKYNKISFRHTKNASIRMDQALKVMNRAGSCFDNFQANIKQMQEKRLDKSMIETFLNGLLNIKDPKEAKTRTNNIKDEIESLMYTGMGNTGKTAFDMYNGATEYADHHRGSESNRDKANLLGAGYGFKAKALDLALELSK